jgi:hypothetical protein
MSDTITNMEFIKVDELNVDQLEIGDFVEINEEIVEVCDITPLTNGYAITYSNDFGEVDLIEVDDYAKFDLFVIAE